MNLYTRWGLGLLLAATALAIAEPSAQAQDFDLCGNSKDAPDDGNAWTLLCKSETEPPDGSENRVMSGVTFENGPDGTTTVNWHITNHGWCTDPNDGPFRCDLQTDIGDDIVINEGNWGTVLDHPVNHATTVCSCNRFSDREPAN